MACAVRNAISVPDQQDLLLPLIPCQLPLLVWFTRLREDEERPIKTLLKFDHTSISKSQRHSTLFKYSGR